MKQAEGGRGANRLPWLGQESEEGSQHHIREFAGWIVAAALLVGGGAYWFAVHTDDSAPVQTAEVPSEPTASAELPTNAAPQSPLSKPLIKVPGRSPAAVVAKPATPPSRPARPVAPESAPVAKVAATATPPAKTAPAPQAKSSSATKQASAASSVKAAASTPSAAPRKSASAASSHNAHPGAVLPVKEARTAQTPQDFARPGSKSALGSRLVQLAAFRNLDDAKLVWRRIEHAYPAMKQFHPALIANRDSTGQLFYQFEVGTASQADSEMLCQSMLRTNFSCTIVRLP